MEIIIGLLIIILFLKIFVGISVGLFKLLMWLFFAIVIITIAPLGILAIGFILPIIILATLLSLVGFILKILF